jgi:hypothetical protein
MTTLPICRPGPFIDYSSQSFNLDNPASPQRQVFVEEPLQAQNFIDPINGACDESEIWKWKYYLKAEKYNFTYGENPVLTTKDERYYIFDNRTATNTRVSESKKLTDDDSVLFDAGWSYISTQDFEWELIYKCKNSGDLALHGCYAQYQYPGPNIGDDYVTVKDPDNGEVNEISKRVKITLPKSSFPRRVSMLIYANVGEDIGAGAEIEFTWRFGPVGSFVD